MAIGVAIVYARFVHKNVAYKIQQGLMHSPVAAKRYSRARNIPLAVQRCLSGWFFGGTTAAPGDGLLGLGAALRLVSFAG